MKPILQGNAPLCYTAENLGIFDMLTLFTNHPREVGETYKQHLFFALTFGISMLIGGIACIIHAFFPFLFQKTASNILFKMSRKVTERNR